MDRAQTQSRSRARGEGFARDSLWRYVRTSRGGRVGLWILAFMAAVALFADLLASDLPIALRYRGETYVLPAVTRPAKLLALDNQLLRQKMGPDDWALFPLCELGPTQHAPILSPPPAAPSAVHWMGTDDRGRDVFARLVHGSRVSLLVGVAAVFVYVVIGVLLGLLAGFYRGWVDALISRLVEIGLTFPTFFLILTVMALLERSALYTLIIVIGLTRWPRVARLMRAEVLRLRELDYVAASRLAGASSLRLMLRHILPHAMPPVIVNATFGIAGAIILEAALSFLGFGTPPPTASWGEILGQSFESPSSWWLIVLPGLCILATVTAINLLGQALQDGLARR
jgi:peptide/nickel transport system permease protein